MGITLEQKYQQPINYSFTFSLYNKLNTQNHTTPVTSEQNGGDEDESLDERIARRRRERKERLAKL